MKGAQRFGWLKQVLKGSWDTELGVEQELSNPVVLSLWWFCLWRQLAMCRDALVGRGQGRCWASDKAQDSPLKQIIIQFKVSVVPLLINAGPTQVSPLSTSVSSLHAVFFVLFQGLFIVYRDSGHLGFSKSKSVHVQVYNVMILITKLGYESWNCEE